MTPLILVALLLPATAEASFPGDRFQTSPVVGANVAVALGALPDGRGRIGAGIDLGYQLQWYSEGVDRVDGRFVVWAAEQPAPNYGPVLHIWKVGGHWHTGAGMRAGIAWPLRIGLGRGWWPGPALTGELGVAISTEGFTAVDLQAAVDAPWTQARLGAAFNARGWHAKRLHLGAFSPTVQPENWGGSGGDQWRAP